MSLGRIKQESVNKIEERSFQIELQYFFIGNEKLFFPPAKKSSLTVSESGIKIPMSESERKLPGFVSKSLQLQWELINRIYIFDNEKKDTAADSLSSLNNVYIVIEPTVTGRQSPLSGMSFLERIFREYLEMQKSKLIFSDKKIQNIYNPEHKNPHNCNDCRQKRIAEAQQSSASNATRGFKHINERKCPVCYKKLLMVAHCTKSNNVNKNTMKRGKYGKIAIV